MRTSLATARLPPRGFSTVACPRRRPRVRSQGAARARARPRGLHLRRVLRNLRGLSCPLRGLTQRLATGHMSIGLFPSGACSPTSGSLGESASLPAPPSWGSCKGGHELETYEAGCAPPEKYVPPRLRCDDVHILI